MDSHELPYATKKGLPVSSLLAELKINADGSRVRLMDKLIAVVDKFPGHTSSELKAILGTKSQVNPRLSDARNMRTLKNGELRKSEISGQMEQTWYINDDPIQRDLLTTGRNTEIQAIRKKLMAISADLSEKTKANIVDDLIKLAFGINAKIAAEKTTTITGN